MERIFRTYMWFILLALIWQGLELLIYKEIQPRVVDDIMGVLFLPFIWKAEGVNAKRADENRK